jgi:hypothetical protein
VRLEKLKFGKVSIVVFLTALIWVWADLAQDEMLTLPDVVVEVAKSSDQSLWVCFVAEQKEPALQTSVTLDSVVLKGPASRVAEVKRLKNKGALDLNLFLTPEREGMTKADTRTLDVRDFLKRSDELRRLGLTVEDCEPKQLTLRVQELVKTSVPVECVGLEPAVQVKSLVPDTVEVFVPKDDTGIRKATIRLMPDEQIRAKNAAVEKTPYIELAPGLRREIATKVKVTLAPAENALIDDRVSAVLGFCFSQNMQGKYRVVLPEDDDPTKRAYVMVQATRDALDLYAKTTPQMILYIRDEDRQSTEPVISREVVFNFPRDSVKAGEIRPNQTPPTVRFRLEAIAEKSTPSGP